MMYDKPHVIEIAPESIVAACCTGPFRDPTGKIWIIGSC